MGELTLSEQTVIDTPSTGQWTLAPKSDGLYQKDDAGVESKLQFDSAAVPMLNNVYVSMSGDNTTGTGEVSAPFRNIATAIDYIDDNYTPANTNAYMVKVAAGHYEEDAFTLPEFVGIDGEGYRTLIEANNSSANFITSEGSHTISNVVLYGVTGGGNYLVYCNVPQSVRIAFQHVAFNPYKVSGGVISNGVYLSAITGTITAEFDNCDFDQVTGDCIYLGGNSEAVTDGINIFDCSGTFIDAQSNSTYSASGVKVITSLGLGVNHLSTGQGNFSDVDFRNAISPMNKTNNAPLLITNAAGTFNDATVTTLEGFSGYFFDEIEGEDTFRIIDECSVGLPGLGKELCVGEGDSYVSGMRVVTYDGTSYVDVSEAARSSDGSSFTFPSSGSTREIYVTSLRQNSEDFLTFQGVKIDQLVAASSDGEFVAEYWNGTSWIEFNHMSTQADRKYYPYAKVLFERTGAEQIRFTKEIVSDWEKNDPTSAGYSTYWMKFRAETVPTTMPTFEKLKVHSNRLEINSDGFIEYFSESRPVLSFSLEGFQAANNSPSNQDLYFQDNFGIGYVENLFADGAVDQASKIVYLPSSVCTACPLRLKVILVCTGNSTAQSDWTIRWVINKTGDSIYTSTASAPSTNPNVQSVNVSVSPTGQYEQFTLEATLDISDYIADNEDGIPDVLGIQIQRNGNSDSNDDDIAMAAVNVFYVKINEGSHI